MSIEDTDILCKILSMGHINKVFPNYVHRWGVLKGEGKLKFSPIIKNLYSELEFFAKEDQTQGDIFTMSFVSCPLFVIPAKVGIHTLIPAYEHVPSSCVIPGTEEIKPA